MVGGFYFGSSFDRRGEAIPKASSLPAVIISYHQAGVNLVCHSFFICGQHYLYRQDEKKEKLNELENLNKILNPQNFMKYKKELEEKDKYLKFLDSGDKDKLINELKIKLQKL